MNGPGSDQPDDQAPDDGGSDGPQTLGELLGISETPQAVLQEYVETALSVTADPGQDGLSRVITSDDFDGIRTAIREETGRNVGHYPMWVRFWREDLRRSLLVVLHSPTPYGEIDLLMVAHPGMLNRTVLRALFRWAFYVGGWARVVARVPPERQDLADLLRRAGFKFEGLARGAFPGVGDLQIWALTASDALWLLPRSHRTAAPIVTRDVAPPPSLKVH